MLAESIVQTTREHDLDRDEKLAKADKYANDAIASVSAAAKPNPRSPMRSGRTQERSDRAGS